MPNYVMKLTEAVWMPKDKDTPLHRVKVAVWVILAIIVIASLIFRESIFKALNWQVRVLLIILCIGTFFVGGHKKERSEMEIRFYDDRLVIYREKFYCYGSVYQKEYNIVPYDGIKEVVFRNETKRLNINGMIEGIWYKYRKDGTVPDEPTYHKTTDSIVYFYTDFMSEEDFIRDFEAHCPIKITIHNT